MMSSKKRRISNFNPFFSFEFDRVVTNAVIDIDGVEVDTKYSCDEFQDCFEHLKIESPPQNTPKESHHLYCLIEREFIQSGENLYKVGKSLHLSQRMSAYPKGSYIISVFKVNDCHVLEKVLLKQLDACNDVTNARDIGREYYRGELKDIMKIFVDVCMSDLWIIK